MRLVVISGHSGSGKSTALHVLEDVGFNCVDNLPASLLPSLVNHMRSIHDDDQLRFAVSIDARNTNQDLQQLPQILQGHVAQGVKVETVFLDCNDTTLLQRFSETRRKHPLSSDSKDLQAAIAAERHLLESVHDLANLVIDTSQLNLHQLRDLIKIRVAGNDADAGMAILFESFGFKHGVPMDVEIMFDLRCLPNPYWKPHLRPYNGLQQPVIEFLEGHLEVSEMVADITEYLEKWLPRFDANNRSYITIGLGCTGGQHRSVYVSERLREYFSKQYKNVQIRHRQLNISDTRKTAGATTSD